VCWRVPRGPRRRWDPRSNRWTSATGKRGASCSRCSRPCTPQPTSAMDRESARARHRAAAADTAAVRSAVTAIESRSARIRPAALPVEQRDDALDRRQPEALGIRGEAPIELDHRAMRGRPGERGLQVKRAARTRQMDGRRDEEPAAVELGQAPGHRFEQRFGTENGAERPGVEQERPRPGRALPVALYPH